MAQHTLPRPTSPPGATIYALRRAQGLSLDDLCARIALRGGSVNKASISRIERHQANPTAEMLEHIAHGLGVRPEDLWCPPTLAPVLALPEPGRAEALAKVEAYVSDLAAAYRVHRAA